MLIFTGAFAVLRNGNSYETIRWKWMLLRGPKDLVARGYVENIVLTLFAPIVPYTVTERNIIRALVTTEDNMVWYPSLLCVSWILVLRELYDTGMIYLLLDGVLQYVYEALSYTSPMISVVMNEKIDQIPQVMSLPKFCM